MVRVRIAEVEKDLNDTDENWINQQINGRRTDGLSVCVRVVVKHDDLDMILSTPTCGPAGGGRLPRPREKTIFDLWNKAGLDGYNFTGGNVVAFLKQLKRML